MLGERAVERCRADDQAPGEVEPEQDRRRHADDAVELGRARQLRPEEVRREQVHRLQPDRDTAAPGTSSRQLSACVREQPGRPQPEHERNDDHEQRGGDARRSHCPLAATAPLPSRDESERQPVEDEGGVDGARDSRRLDLPHGGVGEDERLRARVAGPEREPGPDEQQPPLVPVRRTGDVRDRCRNPLPEPWSLEGGLDRSGSKNPSTPPATSETASSQKNTR